MQEMKEKERSKFMISNRLNPFQSEMKISIEMSLIFSPFMKRDYNLMKIPKYIEIFHSKLHIWKCSYCLGAKSTIQFIKYIHIQFILKALAFNDIQ